MAKKDASRNGESKKQPKTRSSKRDDGAKSTITATTAVELNLLADQKVLDPTLSSLFATKEPSVKPAFGSNSRGYSAARTSRSNLDTVDPSAESDESPDENIESLDLQAEILEPVADPHPKRKRRRGSDHDDVEGAYATRLAREEAKEMERMNAERANKRMRTGEQVEDTTGGELEEDTAAQPARETDPENDEDDASDDDIVEDDDSDVLSPPPRHETEMAADSEMDKANRTVFLGNVSTTAISSKHARKALLTHLSSITSQDQTKEKSGVTEVIESIRFRSTPYASALPKKAAFAKKELMDATTKSTNAYVVYSAQSLARAAAKKLNGTVVLDRHLRVDEVAHPAQIDNRRCIFVGNLGFVDDESNIRQANEDEGREKRKPGKEPADIEEGLWRIFSRCGTVESVRVIRDSVTRVGKGIAYVQFTDENGVEAALLYNEKKFPPMLPRKLRVSRAKAQKRNAKPGSGRPSSRPRPSDSQRKIPAEEASKLGRAGKLLGRAGAAQLRKSDQSRPVVQQGQQVQSAVLDQGFQKPETFIFEGHRATARHGKVGLKLGGRTGKKSGVTKRSAAFKKKKRSAS